MTKPTSITTPTLTLPEGLPGWQVEATHHALTRVTIDPETGCWISGWYRDSKGYSRMNSRAGKPRLVHRLVLASVTGRDLGNTHPRLFAMHSCDNPPCCNPAHLAWGTALENNRDMFSKGRGSDTPWSVRQREVTHCPRGHRLHGHNLTQSGKSAGRRRCLICMRARSAVRNASVRQGITISVEAAIADELARTDNGRDLVACDALS